MRKIIVICFILLLTVMLTSCRSQVNATATFDIGEEAIEQTRITFNLNINDPENEITGSITVRLYRADDTEVTARVYDNAPTITDIIFTALDSNASYTIKVFAAVGRTSALIGETTFQTLTMEDINITTVAEFKNMRNHRSGTYVLMNDLDFSEEDFASPFTSSFSGSFDGQGYTLRNINFARIATYTGVFGYVSSGTIKNVNLDNVTIGTEESPLNMTTSSRVGILAGYVSSTVGVVENVTITNSQIHYRTSSTIQAYVGGVVGEHNGFMENVVIEDVEISVKSTRDPRIKLGGVVGFLTEDAKLREIKSDVNVRFELEANAWTDTSRDFSAIYVGGVIGDNNARNIPRAVENVYATGDIDVILDFNIPETATGGSMPVYVGGLAGITYGGIHNAFFGGSINLVHEAREDEGTTNKNFFVGGLVGFYASNRASHTMLRIGDDQTITVTAPADVNLRLSQTIAHQLSSVTLTTAVFGETHLVLNDLSIVDDDDITVIDSIDDFFTSTWMEEAFAAVYGNNVS